MLANRLSKVVKHLVHPDQSGFIPARSTSLNIRRLFLNQQIPSDNVGNRVILLLDAAKMFDGVEWSYLWEVLKRFGVGTRFVRWVQLLYFCPQASMLINGFQSESFSLHRGTHQRSLSLLLFALAVEPLAEAIRQSRNVVVNIVMKI